MFTIKSFYTDEEGNYSMRGDEVDHFGIEASNENVSVVGCAWPIDILDFNMVIIENESGRTVCFLKPVTIKKGENLETTIKLPCGTIWKKGG